MENNETLSRLKSQLNRAGSLESPVVHQVEPSFRTPSQVAFNPELVARIVDAPKDDGPM